MQPTHIAAAIQKGGNCSLLTERGGLQGYASLAAAGLHPNQFEVGVLVPMPHSGSVPAGGTLTVTLFPHYPVLPVAAMLDFSGADITIDNIFKPDGNIAGIKGAGISTDWDPAWFSYEALRSCVNPFPRDVGIITSSDGLAYEVDNAGAAAELFEGITFGFLAGLQGIAYMQSCGMISQCEAAMLRKVQGWIDTGSPPPEVIAAMAPSSAPGGNSGAAPGGNSGARPTGQKCMIGSSYFELWTDGTYKPVP